MSKIAIGMSGGVDSSAAALRLLNGGNSLLGVTLKLHGDNSSDCLDAARVCSELCIPHKVLDLEAIFAEKVIGDFISEYSLGSTPNPCIVCNREIKFGAMLDYALELGCDKIATGHYARLEESGGRYLLKRAKDPSKDQSYVLYVLNQHQLSRSVFPLGELSKAQVRSIAEESGLITANRPDSQDICFVPDGDYSAFISSFSGKSFKKGSFTDAEGKILGEHQGIINYTVGQRKGLGIALGRPMFVLEKNASDNTVVLGDEPGLFYSIVEIERVNFIPFDSLSGSMRVSAKLRYRHEAQPATLHPLEKNRVLLEFDTPQRAPSPGQSAVFFDGEYVIGGGIILKGRKQL